MKRDLYLIAEAYGKRGKKPTVKSNVISREYVLFFGIYNKNFSNKFAEGKLIKYSDLTEHEKGLLKLMNRYATTGNFYAYEMKARSYLKFSTFIAFVGSEETIRDIVNDYQVTHGSDFEFEEREPLPMKRKTKKHFGDIFAGLKESKNVEPELYALILHLQRKDSEKDYYFLKKLEDLNEEEKKILKSEEGRITSFKPGVHKFREYFPDKKPGEPYTNTLNGRRILMYVAPKDILDRELSYYKMAYGKNLEPGVTVKPKTKEVFGDIVGGLQEGFKGTKGTEVLDISVKGCIKKESKWQQPVLVNQVAEYIISMEAEPSTVWRGYDEYYIEISVAEFEPMEGDDRPGLQYNYRRVKEWNFGSFNDANQIGWRWYNMYEKEIIREIKKYKVLKEMKPKTKKHFGDIVSGLQESKKKDPYNDHVLIQRFNYDKNNYKSGVYEIKPANKLDEEELSLWKATARMHSYMHGYQKYDIGGYDEIQMIFGTKEELEEDVEETKKYMMGHFKERIPMKPKTKESFADIFNKLNESKKKEPLWVLIIKFNKLKTSKYNDQFKYIISPLDELSEKNREIYDRATDWIQPAYNRVIELNTGPHVGGVDMGNYKAEVFRGPEKVVRGELESHSRIYNMVEEVPLKGETEKHFRGIV